MARQFASGQDVDFGNISAHQAYTEITVLVVVYNDNLTSDHNYFSNETNVPSNEFPILLFMDDVVSGGGETDRYRAITHLTSGTLDSIITGAGVAKANTWQAILYRWQVNTTNGQTLWVRDLGSSTVSKVTQNASNGTVHNSGVSCVAGVTPIGRAHNGREAMAATWSRSITDAEAESLIASLDPNSISTTSRQLYCQLWGNASPEADLSGNGNNGVVTGATQVDHAPFGRYAPRRSYKPPTIITPAAGRIMSSLAGAGGLAGPGGIAGNGGGLAA